MLARAQSSNTLAFWVRPGLGHLTNGLLDLSLIFCRSQMDLDWAHPSPKRNESSWAELPKFKPLGMEFPLQVPDINEINFRFVQLVVKNGKKKKERGINA